jgi:hypothetical protein
VWCHYPDGLSGGHPNRVWTLAAALALNAALRFAPVRLRPSSSRLDMPRITPLARLRVPLGGQEIELQQLEHDAGGMSLLRTRIREKSRFTVFEIDPLTARAWGEALLAWARAQPGAAAGMTDAPGLAAGPLSAAPGVPANDE